MSGSNSDLAASHDPLAPLEAALGYRFVDRNLLQLALTRRGAARANNERLEFLGDAVLDLVVSEELYRRHPQASESELTIARSYLVRRRSLARLATQLDLGSYLRLADSERQSGTHQRESALADGLEAVLGAVYLDAGLAALHALVLALLDERLSEAPRGQAKDAKSRLQEWLQGSGQPRPQYTIVAEEGPQHERMFLVCAALDDGLAAHGRGDNRRAAEQRAAERLLLCLGTATAVSEVAPT